ncbi:MAG: hypothetical protein KGQ36_01850 [Rickettsiales bacterium]|nr:hypothetical protein [Rickettsiales bacterium]
MTKSAADTLQRTNNSNLFKEEQKILDIATKDPEFFRICTQLNNSFQDQINKNFDDLIRRKKGQDVGDSWFGKNKKLLGSFFKLFREFDFSPNPLACKLSVEGKDIKEFVENIDEVEKQERREKCDALLKTIEKGTPDAKEREEMHKMFSKYFAEMAVAITASYLDSFKKIPEKQPFITIHYNRKEAFDLIAKTVVNQIKVNPGELTRETSLWDKTLTLLFEGFKEDLLNPEVRACSIGNNQYLRGLLVKCDAKVYKHDTKDPIDYSPMKDRPIKDSGLLGKKDYPPVKLAASHQLSYDEYYQDKGSVKSIISAKANLLQDVASKGISTSAA